MKVKKSDLKFLKDYNAIVETSTVLGNKLKIKVENNVATYVQNSKSATLITSIPCSTNESFDLLVETKTFWNFLNTLEEEDILTIEQDGFTIGEDKKYTFDLSQLDFINIDDLLVTIENLKSNSDTISFDFKEYDELKTVFPFMGKDSLESIGLMKNKILATDRIQIVYSECEFSLDENYFISKLAGQLLKENIGSVTKIYIDEDFYFFNKDNTLCIFQWEKCIIPDIFQESSYSKFNQKDNVEVNTKEIKNCLKRMSYFTFDNPSFRIFITIKDDHLIIENRDYNKSYEKIPLLKGNPLLNDVTFIVNSNNLLNFINHFEDNSINLFINPSSDNRNSIRLEDAEGKYKFVHILLRENL